MLPFLTTSYCREFAILSSRPRPRSSRSSFTAVIPKIIIKGAHVVNGFTGVISAQSCRSKNVRNASQRCTAVYWPCWQSYTSCLHAIIKRCTYLQHCYQQEITIHIPTAQQFRCKIAYSSRLQRCLVVETPAVPELLHQVLGDKIVPCVLGVGHQVGWILRILFRRISSHRACCLARAAPATH